MRSWRPTLVPVWALLCLSPFAGEARDWTGLLERNPFVAFEPPKPPAPEPPPPYEFRGRSVENGVEYFSLYNLESKKAQWVSRADGGDLRVRGYDPIAGLELADQAGRTIRLALKAGKSTGGGIRLRPGTVRAVEIALRLGPSVSSRPVGSRACLN